jgi:tRNA G37 N-methylase TrmD
MKLAQAKNTTDNKWTKLDDGLYSNGNGEIMTADELK